MYSYNFKQKLFFSFPKSYSSRNPCHQLYFHWKWNVCFQISSGTRCSHSIKFYPQSSECEWSWGYLGVQEQKWWRNGNGKMVWNEDCHGTWTCSNIAWNMSNLEFAQCLSSKNSWMNSLPVSWCSLWLNSLLLLHHVVILVKYQMAICGNKMTVFKTLNLFHIIYMEQTRMQVLNENTASNHTFKMYFIGLLLEDNFEDLCCINHMECLCHPYILCKKSNEILKQHIHRYNLVDEIYWCLPWSFYSWKFKQCHDFYEVWINAFLVLCSQRSRCLLSQPNFNKITVSSTSRTNNTLY